MVATRRRGGGSPPRSPGVAPMTMATTAPRVLSPDGGREAATHDDGLDDVAASCWGGQRMEEESHRSEGRPAAVPFFLFAVMFFAGG